MFVKSVHFSLNIKNMISEEIMISSLEQIQLVNMKEPGHLVNWLLCIILHVLPL